MVKIKPGSYTGGQAVANPWKQARVRARKEAKTGPEASQVGNGVHQKRTGMRCE